MEREKRDKIIDGIFIFAEITAMIFTLTFLLSSCRVQKTMESEHVRTDSVQQSDSVNIRNTAIASEKERERSVTSKTDSTIVTTEKVIVLDQGGDTVKVYVNNFVREVSIEKDSSDRQYLMMVASLLEKMATHSDSQQSEEKTVVKKTKKSGNPLSNFLTLIITFLIFFACVINIIYLMFHMIHLLLMNNFL